MIQTFFIYEWIICAPHKDETFNIDNLNTFAFVITSAIMCNFTRIADRVMDEQKILYLVLEVKNFLRYFGQIYFGRLAV